MKVKATAEVRQGTESVFVEMVGIFDANTHATVPDAASWVIQNHAFSWYFEREEGESNLVSFMWELAVDRMVELGLNPKRMAKLHEKAWAEHFEL